MNELSAGQADAVLAIASQCPMVGGNAVFRARSLYAMVDPTLDFNDSLICAGNGIEVRSMSRATETGLRMLPNPAMDAATLVLDVAQGERVQLVLYAATGQVAARHTVPAGAERFTFATDGLAPGVYHYAVQALRGSIGQGQLSVIH